MCELLDWNESDEMFENELRICCYLFIYTIKANLSSPVFMYIYMLLTLISIQ